MALELARKLADGPKAALVLTRELAWGAFDRSFADQLAAERSAQKKAGGGEEFREGLRAFREKRKPQFRLASES